MAPPASVLASTKRGRGRPRKQRTTHTHCGTTNTTFQSIDVSMPLPSSPSQPPEQPRKKRGRPSQKVNGSQCGKQNQPSITSWYSSLTDQTINRAECEASERITGRKQNYGRPSQARWLRARLHSSRYCRRLKWTWRTVLLRPMAWSQRGWTHPSFNGQSKVSRCCQGIL